MKTPTGVELRLADIDMAKDAYTVMKEGLRGNKPRKRKGDRTPEDILADSPPGTQTPGVQNTAAFTGPLAFGRDPAPMLGRTQSAIDREAGPAPEMRPVPSEIRRRNAEAQQANIPIVDSQRMQDSEREVRFQQEAMGMGQPEMDMPPAPPQPPAPRPEMNIPPAPPQPPAPQPEINIPPAPQPEMNMTPAPPTNEFGQPVRGVLPGESAPEDPQKIMEEFGRGSPEHVRALQERMRTQQVARSRTEDMNDPRLAHLPTAKEYQMDLTRRTHGEERIDKRAAELMKPTPENPMGRSQEEAVRLAGREALDRKRQDRGMLSFEDRDAQRADLRMKQQEMFRQRRDARAARRQERFDRRELEEDARRAGMSVLEYQRYQAETDALRDPMRIAKMQAQTNQAAIEAGERTAETTAGAQVQSAEAAAGAKVRSQEIQSGAAEAMNKLDSETKVKVENIKAGVSRDQIEQSKREMLGKEWFQSAQLQMMEAKNFNEAQARFMQIAQQENLGRQDLFGFAEALISSGIAIDAGTASTMASLAAINIERAMSEAGGPPPVDPVSAVIPSPPPADEAAAPPQPAAPPAARPRLDDRPETRRPEPAPEEAQPEATPGWVQDLSEVEAGTFRMTEADANRQKEELSRMNDSVSSILELAKSNPEAAREQAARISQAMIDANPDIESRPLFGVASDYQRMTAANRNAYMLLAQIASGGDFSKQESRYIDGLGEALQGYKPRDRRGR